MNLLDKASMLKTVLADRGITVGFAESLTGGLISATLVSVPGASEIFKGSIVSYANEVKMNVLGVEPEVINTVGPVSEECAIQMASGVRSKINCDIAVSVTGVAGPDGGTEEKPVGTVYIGFASADKKYSRRFQIIGQNRDEIRNNTVSEAFNLIMEELSAL